MKLGKEVDHVNSPCWTQPCRTQFRNVLKLTEGGGQAAPPWLLDLQVVKKLSNVVVATHVTGSAWHLLKGNCLQRREERSFVSQTSGRPIQWNHFKAPVLALWVHSAVETCQTSRALQQESLPKCDQCKLPLQGIKSQASSSFPHLWIYVLFCKPHFTPFRSGSVSSGSKTSSGLLFVFPLWKRFEKQHIMVKPSWPLLFSSGLGQNFLEAKGKPFCIECYSNEKAEKCNGCRMPIVPIAEGEQQVNFLNLKEMGCTITIKMGRGSG